MTHTWHTHCVSGAPQFVGKEPALIELKGFSFRYPEGPGPVLDNVDLSFRAGEFVLVAGPSGSGKSTLLRALNGLVPHFSGGRVSGRVRVADHDPIAEGPRGKPEVAGDLRFSVSHSAGLALYAVVRGRETGVDVERLRPVSHADRIAQQWFCEEERRTYLAGRTAAPELAFFGMWTRREAYLKAVGIGLVGSGAREPIDLARWEVHELAPAQGYVGALVVERARPGGPR